MKLFEYQGKELFKEYNIPIPEGFVVSNSSEINNLTKEEYAIKSQILAGSRKKSGGIKFAKKDEVKKIVEEILSSEIKGIKVNKVLVEEKLKIDKELYCSIIVNRGEREITFLYSSYGGIDIEETAKNNPNKIKKINIYDFDEKKILKKLGNVMYKKQIMDILKKLYKIMKDKDAMLVEINPLVVSKGECIAADSKIIIDDNSLFKHPEFHKNSEEMTELELKAEEAGIQYVELDGNIGIIGNGAGMVMATIDLINYFGGKAANFLDVGAGAPPELMEKAIDIVLRKKGLKALFINIFGGLTKCDEMAEGMIRHLKNHEIKIPTLVRMIGTNHKKGMKMLRDRDFILLIQWNKAQKS